MPPCTHLSVCPATGRDKSGQSASCLPSSGVAVHTVHCKLYCVLHCVYTIPLLGSHCSLFCYCPFSCYSYFSPRAAHRGRISLWISPSAALSHSVFFVCFVMFKWFFFLVFFAGGRGVFLIFLENFKQWFWVRNCCCCCGPAKPFETLYMTLVCANKRRLVCNYIIVTRPVCVCVCACVCVCVCVLCVWIEAVLFVRSPSASRHVPMICYYLFPSLLTKKVTWHLPWGFNRHVSWRTRKMAFTVIEFRGP